MSAGLDIVILGLSITSSWGNGHATTWRGLVREMARRGHRISFLERDVPWYRASRDMPAPEGCRTLLYDSLEALKDSHAGRVRRADVVIVGSYVPDGVAVVDWVRRTARGLTAFYDIDTPVTLAGLATGGTAYLAARQIPAFDLYLSFTGGPTLLRLERDFGAARARALYCSADPDTYRPRDTDGARHWTLGYLGTYSPDRQPVLDSLLLRVAASLPDGRFVVAGPQYPADIAWPGNVERIEHLPPDRHRDFYTSQQVTLNVTRADMVMAGWSPSVRLFEAAACGTPIISDFWQGLSSLFTPGHEIVIARNTAEVRAALAGRGREDWQAMGRRARARVLAAHTAAHRAEELESHLEAAMPVRASRLVPLPVPE